MAHASKAAGQSSRADPAVEEDDISSPSSSSSESNAPLDLSADQEWQDVEPDEEAVQVLSFFDDVVFGSVAEMLRYTQTEHGLDVLDIVRRFGGCVSCLCCLGSRHSRVCADV